MPAEADVEWTNAEGGDYSTKMGVLTDLGLVGS
jgi:hypothetical protein